ncbi:monovalent cation/H(+) antiporter subunit G [Pseudothermotoga thermarum]|uniref:monovalent cation/H(+) antiporter subunit G n=1 Tax=Pseudothermotoga thermarum TaxID=119394 RepID=UPI00031B3D4F|nr:monovalent cation/H(+) antiporter subunit G [Pseudothermotoga thermarum]
MEIVKNVFLIFSSFLIILGAFASLMSAIGMFRFKDYFLRIHASTVGTIWGSVVPLLGVALFALFDDKLGSGRYVIASNSFLTAAVFFIVGPLGTHLLTRSVYKLRKGKCGDANTKVDI